MTENVYGVLVDPSKGVSLQKFPSDEVGLNEMYSAIDCDYVELSRLTNELDLWVDEEGFINGASQRIGAFQVQDADGEVLGQNFYAGRGLILSADDDGRSIGLTKERAEKVAKSLIFQTSFFSPIL
jgi:hypothetical protein